MKYPNDRHAPWPAGRSRSVGAHQTPTGQLKHDAAPSSPVRYPQTNGHHANDSGHDDFDAGQPSVTPSVPERILEDPDFTHSPIAPTLPKEYFPPQHSFARRHHRCPGTSSNPQSPSNASFDPPSSLLSSEFAQPKDLKAQAAHKRDFTPSGYYDVCRAMTPSAVGRLPYHRENFDCRPATATGGSMIIENFSRPRKPSVKHQERFVADHHSTNFDRSTLVADGQVAAHHLDHHNSTYQQAALPLPRDHSVSSTQLTSGLPSVRARPSNDQLYTTSRRSPSRPPQNQTSNQALVMSRRPMLPQQGNSSQNREISPRQGSGGDEARSSFRSQLTSSTSQGTLFTGAETERSSVATSSITESSINGYVRTSTRVTSVLDDGTSVEDVMGMYEEGFGHDFDGEGGLTVHARRRPYQVDRAIRDEPAGELSRQSSTRTTNSGVEAKMLEAKMLEAMSDFLPIPGASRVSHSKQRLDSPACLGEAGGLDPRPKGVALVLASAQRSHGDDPEAAGLSTHDSGKVVREESKGKVCELVERDTQLRPAVSQLPQEAVEDAGSRDRYGFKKANAYISREQYEAWNGPYTEYLARRHKKWIAFMKENSLMTENPNRFPPRDAKTKRFIRKGIPPSWRGAAWFYYAGGPAILANHGGLYDDLVRRAGLDVETSGRLEGVESEVRPLVAEDIEKDLHRTFPDNARFKAPRFESGQDGPGRVSSDGPASEPEIISSLRRVLSAFALYNPRIGYCQSLNFLAGLLLLFVDTEERAFWLLNVITRVYLPGTHETSLEGSKVDLGVLMDALQERMPSVWKHVAADDVGVPAIGKKPRVRRGQQPKPNDPNRLPAITLCMTAWFMSCFIGTLPIETVLRVWDVFFYEGSRTLFRISLTIFKMGETEIKKIKDPMEMFSVVQSIPRRMIDCNMLLEACYRRRNGIGHLSQDALEERRLKARSGIRKWKADQEAAAQGDNPTTSSATAGLDLATETVVRRKGTIFGRRKDRDREQIRAAEVV